MPEEQQLIARARHQRRLEFATGRVLARRLLREFGAPSGALLPGPDGAPHWPPGVIGSIAHCRDRCAAVMTRSGGIVGLGVDIERNAPIEPELWDTILNEDELAWMAAPRGIDPGRLATLLFSAKESIYKCVRAQMESMLEFSDVSVRMNDARNEFTVRFRDGVQSGRCEADRIHGWADAAGQWVITVAVLTAGDVEDAGATDRTESATIRR